MKERRNAGAGNASATDAKSGAKKADAVLNTVKKTIELVATKVSKNSSDNSNATVDSHVPNAHLYEVAKNDSSGEALSTYLNWSDLKKNHNKFYIQQVLQRKGQTGSSFNAVIFTRYGRVGSNGVTSFKDTLL